MTESSLKIAIPSQGWKQFLTARQDLLSAYDTARIKARSHEIETYHGKVSEAEFRRWLSEFLPKRYGVTAGYVISSGVKCDEKAPHFDVIIYDALNAPVLWIEGDPDVSRAGRSMAIPVEYVQGVLEVKAAMNAKSTADAVEHLADLKPLMQNLDAPGERYKLHLPEHFFCGVIYFELRKADEYSEAALSNILSGLDLRGFIGGLVLRGDGHTKPVSGRISILRSEEAIESSIGRTKESLLQSAPMSASICVTDKLHFATMLLWSEVAFSQFAFDLVAIMQGTYEVGRLSSFYGIGTSDMEGKW
jgi:hypothetical protein